MLIVAKHEKTLAAIFEEPARANINWKDIELLFLHDGGEVTQGKGSRVRVALNGVRAVFHRPHPANETKKKAVGSVREFQTEAGVTP
ncbi:MAG: type II toxin-antitoxin system HicA family toxin [Planctomycetaceae bacterium]